MQLSLTDPIPFFLVNDTVLYLAAEESYVFTVPLETLRKFSVDEIDVVIDDDDDDAELTQLRSSPHPFGCTTTCASLASKDARVSLAEAAVFEDDDLAPVLNDWVEYCDAVAEEVRNDVPLRDVLARPWPSAAAGSTSRA